MKKLDQDTCTAIFAAQAALDEAAAMIRDFISEKSERWQEGDKGESYGTWAERLEEVAAALEETPLTIDDVD